MIDEKILKEEIDDYEFTLQTLAAISNIFEYNFDAKNTYGKSMVTSKNNVIQPNVTVTPDLVSELDVSKKENCGLVTEIKVDLPKNQQYWEESVKQLKKYDDDLTGWDSKNISYRDIIFVTNIMRTHAFTQFLGSEPIQKKYSFDRNLAVLNSSRLQQASAFMVIKKEHGKFTNAELDAMITNGVGVPWTVILPMISNVKFYDSKPPVIYTMMIIWDHILKTYVDLKQRRDLGRRRTIEVMVSIAEITEKLSIYAPRTNPHCINQDWIREALHEFEQIDLAIPLNRETGTYRIRITTHKGDLRSWFIEKFKEIESKKNQTLDKFIKENPGEKISE